MKLRGWLMVFLVAPVGCGGGVQEPVSAAKPDAYALKGVVRKVDPNSGEVTIAHEAMPGLMPAMTMPFTLKDREALEVVHPGDGVEGRLRVVRDGKGEVKDYELIDLVVTRPDVEPPPSAAPEGPALLKPGDLVPDFAVTTQDGGALRLSDLRGKVVALTFIYTRCPLPEFCPAMDARFADLARRASSAPGRGDRVRLLSVSFDPAHDTPAILADHARRRGAKPPLWTFAVASLDELAKVSGPMGLTVAPGSREIAHNLRAAVIGPDGRLIRLEAGSGWSPGDLFGTIRAAIPAPEGSGG